MSEIKLEVAAGVATITVSNTEAHNGLTVGMSRQLSDVCDEIDHDAGVAAAVIRGDGGTFCSGADTRAWTPDIDWAADGYDLLGAIYAGFARVGELKVPTIAAVRGAAVGAGMNLMLVCDLRIVALDARIIAGFLRIGLHPGGGFFTLLGRAAGREAAAAMALFGAELRGDQAVARGLAWEAVTDEEVEPRASQLAAAATRDPELARRAIATLRGELGPPFVSWATALEMERAHQLRSMHRRFHPDS